MNERAREDIESMVIDENGDIGLLGEAINMNGRSVRDSCDECNIEILNKTIADGNVTW